MEPLRLLQRKGCMTASQSFFGIFNIGIQNVIMSRNQRYQAFQAALVEARQKAKLTQVEVAARLGKPQSFVSKYESGERRLDVVEFVDVCAALGINANLILEQLEAQLDDEENDLGTLGDYGARAN
jgi:ribosome-binding protein aMBF1 (putative translation factor)